MTVAIGRIAANWWQRLQPSELAGLPRSQDRAALARLRHCRTIRDAIFDPATHTLCHDLAAGETGLERAALIAAVLACVRIDNPHLDVARQISLAGARRAQMSDLRFRRLLQADTADEQLVGFRHLVVLARHTLHVADLAQALWRWSDQDRRRWVCAYHDAPIAATADAP